MPSLKGLAGTPEITKAEYLEAITEGVRRGFTKVAVEAGMLDMPPDGLLEAVRMGTHDAIWRVATNATEMPCRDFYDFIKDGVAEGVARLGLDSVKELGGENADTDGQQGGRPSV